jgi:hypothetical protein
MEKVLHMRGVKRISVHDEVTVASEGPGHGIAEIASDLRHPGPIGVGSDAGNVNASRLEVDDEQHQVAHQASAREHLHAEKVRGRDGAPVRLEEGLPRHRPPSERSRFDAVLLEDSLDGGAVVAN